MTQIKNTSSKKLPLNLHQYSNELIDLIQFWIPPVPAFKPHKKKKNSSLRIAAIVDERLFHGLRYEGELLILTPDNWEHILNYMEIDFLIVESCWQTITGHWHLGESVHEKNNKELLDILSLAQKKSIPSVFWNTQDHLYHSHYNKFATHFDHVFCADPEECRLLEKENVKAKILLPAIQPAIHNGFREYDPASASFCIDLLFDGFTDLYRLEKKLTLLKDLIPYGLKIIDSQGEIFKTKIADLPLFRDIFLGTVNHSNRLTTLKYCKCAITTEKTLRTKTLQQWQTLETLACRVPVLHNGKLDNDDIRSGLISCHEQDDELLVTLESFRQDDLYRKRLGHLAWRELYQKHTFAHRLSNICKALGISHDYEEYPLVSVVTPTFRENRYKHCIENFNHQKYPKKELILVVNNNETNISLIPALKDCPPNVHIHFSPQDKFAGACLNIGNSVAQGKYCLRMDDDDYYGEYYIQDIIMHLKSIEADIFGSPPYYFYFEKEQRLYRKIHNRHFLTIASPEYYGDGNIWIAGNTIGGQTEFLKRETYHNNIFGAADAAFTCKIKNKVDYFLLLDEFNMVINRSENIKQHTWRMSNSKIQKNLEPYLGATKDDLLF